MEVWRERNVGTTIYFPLIDRGTQDFESTPVSFVAADAQFSVDGGAFANTGSTPTHEGGGIYSLVLVAAEVNGQNTVIKLVDAATKAFEDQAIIISTYGDASAEHAFNLNLATQPVNLTQLLGSAIATPTVAGVLEVDVTHQGGGAIPAPAITGVPNVNMTHHVDVAASVTNSELDVNVGQLVGTVPSLTSGDLDVNVFAMASAVITATVMATGSIDANALTTGAGTEIAAAVWDRDATLSQTQGSFGGTLGDQAADGDDVFALLNANLDVVLSTRSSHSAADVWTSGTRDLTANTNFNDPTAVTIAAAVWDLDATAHQTLGTFGQAIGDPGVDTSTIWDLCNTNLDTTVASRATPVQVNAEVATALADVNLDHLVGTAVGIPAVTTGTYLDQIMDDGTATFDRLTDSLQAIRDTAPLGTAMRGTDSAALAAVCTEVRLAELNAANLPTDIANLQSDADDIQMRLPAALVAGRMDGSVGAMASNVLTAASIATGAIDSGALDSTAVNEIADGVWDELLSGHVVPGSFGKRVNDVPLGIQKNTARNNIPFLMVLTSDHVTPATGLTVTGQRSIDAGAFVGVSGTITEVVGAVGIYQFDALAADLNGDLITFRFFSGTADDRFLTVVTSPEPV